MASPDPAVADFDLPAIAAPASQEAARLIVAPPRPEALARGLVIIQFLPSTSASSPSTAWPSSRSCPVSVICTSRSTTRPGHWVHANREPLIIQGLLPGPHRVLIELADPTHMVIASQAVDLTVPERKPPA